VGAPRGRGDGLRTHGGTAQAATRPKSVSLS
jgi:hypothetical protein